MCQQPITTTTTLAPGTSYLFTQDAQGKRWASGDLLSDGVSYTSGQQCCDACSVLHSNYQWASVGVVGTDKEGNCYCKKTPKSKTKHVIPPLGVNPLGSLRCEMMRKFIKNM